MIVQEQTKPDSVEVTRDKIKVKGDIVAGGPVHIGGVHINNPIYVNQMPPVDESVINTKAAEALTQLKTSYSMPEYTTIPGIFGRPLKLEGQYINLQILCTDLRTKQTEESKESAEVKPSEKYKDARMASVEDLFGDKRVIKTEDLFKPTRALFNHPVLPSYSPHHGLEAAFAF